MSKDMKPILIVYVNDCPVTIHDFIKTEKGNYYAITTQHELVPFHDIEKMAPNESHKETFFYGVVKKIIEGSDSPKASEYDSEIPKNADVMDIEEFIEDCSEGYIGNDDGIGHPVKNGRMNSKEEVYPNSMEYIDRNEIDYTHVAWFNK